MGKKLDPKVAEKVMLKAGLKPLEPYQNSKVSWKCKCVKCNKIVFPKFQNIKQGGGGCIPCGYLNRTDPRRISLKDAEVVMLKAGLKPIGPYKGAIVNWKCECMVCKKIYDYRYYSVKSGTSCIFCSGNKIDQKDAVVIMQKAGLEPLEPFINSGTPWRCKCLTCGKTPSPTLANIRGGKGCKYCGQRLIDPKDAEVVMFKAGLKPLEPFKTGLTKWKCIHIECGEVVYPPYKDIKAGRYGCATCGMKAAGLRRRIPEKKAISVMLKAKLKPLESYKGADKKWKCKCLGCGDIVYPKYVSVLQRGGACTTCGTIRRGIKRRTPEDNAVETMLKAKLKPLEPYTNTKTRWKCKCLKCGTVVHPTLGSIVAGDGGCSTCAPFGINMLNPSYLYLITHANLNAHKVGIGNHKKKKDRLSRFIKAGWEAHKVWQTKTGVEALEIEKRVFKILRKDMKLPIYLSKEDMPKTDGHSETVDADSISLLQLEKIINKVIKGMKR